MVLGKGNLRRLCFWSVVAVALLSVFVYSSFLLRCERNASEKELSAKCRNLSRQTADKKRVYFLETSGKDSLDLRQMAALESAARYLVDSAVTVIMFPRNGLRVTPVMRELARNYDVKFTTDTMRKVFEGTPLEGWFESGLWKNVSYRMHHLSDAVRLAVLWRHGGIYVDLDLLFTRNWTFPENCLVTEDENGVANTIMAFRRHHPLLLALMEEFAESYDPSVFAANGPVLIRRVLKRVRHPDVLFLPATGFFEIRYSESHKLFREEYRDEVLRRTSDVVGVHAWNYLSYGFKINTTTDCSYVHIVRKTSPVTFKFMTQAGSF